MNQPLPSARYSQNFLPPIKILIIVHRKRRQSNARLTDRAELRPRAQVWIYPGSEMPLASYTIPVDVGGFIRRLIHRRPFVFPCQPSSTGNGISNRFDVESRWNYRILNKLPGNRNGSSRVPSSRTVEEHGQVISLEWCFVDWSFNGIESSIEWNEMSDAIGDFIIRHRYCGELCMKNKYQVRGIV